MSKNETNNNYIIIVNDDLTQRNIFKSILVNAGFTVKTYEKASESLKEIIGDNIPDLIVTDLHMPGIDGWKFCRLLRSPEYEYLNDVPVMVVSATFAGDEIEKISSGIGANAFMQSPVDPKLFIENIKALLSGKKPKSFTKVLIVEDSATISSILKKNFELYGYIAQASLNGSDAIENIRKNIYDVAVIDFHLPDIQGDELLRLLVKEQPGCAVIMMTADPRPSLAVEWMENGASAYLRKPFDPAYLIGLCDKARREKALLRIEDILEERTKKLLKEEKKYRLLAENSSDVIWTRDMDLNLTYISPSIEKLTGWTAEEAMKMPIKKRFTEDSAYIISTLLGGEFSSDYLKNIELKPFLSQALELEMLRKDGSKIWVETTINYIFDENKNFQSILGITRDISIRKEIEKKHELRLKCQDIIAMISVILMHTSNIDDKIKDSLKIISEFLDIDCSYIYISNHNEQKTENIYHWCKKNEFYKNGLSDEKLIKEFILINKAIKNNDVVYLSDFFYIPSDFEFLKKYFGHNILKSLLILPISNGFDFNGFMRFDSRECEKNWSEETLVFLRIVCGVIARTIDRKMQEEKLQHERKIFLDGAVVVFEWEAKEGWPVKYVSKNVRNMLGYTQSRLQSGEPVFADLVFRDDIKRVSDEVEYFTSIGALSFKHNPYRLKDINGKIVWVEDYTTIFRDSSGKPTYYKGYLVNVTERLQLKNTLEKQKSLTSNILASIKEPLIILDCDGTIILANDAWFDFVSHGTSKCAESLKIGCNYLSGYLRNPSLNTDEKILEYISNLEDRLLGVMQGELPYATVEFKCRWPGINRYFLLHISPMKDFPEKIIILYTDITEQKLIEESLRFNEERMDLIIKSASIGTWDWYIKTGNVVFNDCWQEMIGYKREQTDADISFLETLIHKDDKTRVMALISGHLDGKTDFYESEHRLLHREGKWIWIQDKGKVVEYDAFGAPFRMCGVHIDITKRKEAEEQLKKERDHSANIIEGTNAGTWEWNIQTGELVINERWAEIIGYKIKEFEPININSCKTRIHPDDLHKMMDKLSEHFEGMSDYDLEFRMLHKNGGYVWLNSRGKITKRDKQGNPMLMSGINLDITERKKSEEEIRKLIKVVEQTPVSVVITDKNGNIEYVNPRFTEVTGYEYHEALYQNPRILKSGELSLKEYEYLWKTISSGKVWKGRFHNKKKNGELFWEEAIISPLFDEKKNIINYIGLKEDITKKIALEEQLRQSQKMEAIGRLAGGIAHDMNNLLTPIFAATDLLKMQFLPEDKRLKRVNTIMDSAERAKNLVRQLLTFSRKQNMEYSILDLNNLINSFMKLLRSTIRENIAINFSPAENLPHIKGDTGQIEQIIMNLAINAQQAMENGGELFIATGIEEINQNNAFADPDVTKDYYVTLKVADSGHGMDAETEKKIFEPFFTTKKGIGTGLGLSTVHGIVTQHKGCIKVFTEPGKGAEFKIYFPVTNELLTKELTNDFQFNDYFGKKETILLVEDNYDVLKVVSEILEYSNYNVVNAKNSKEAFSMFNIIGFNTKLLITDVIMPGMRGDELYIELSKKIDDLRVLFMSGYMPEEFPDIQTFGKNAQFIQKPFKPNEFLNKIKDLLKK